MGFLNFLSWAIFPGRAFTRSMYAKYSRTINDKSGKFKKYHHVRLDQEFKFDCDVWKLFLQGDIYTFACRPMLNINNLESATQLEFYSDASRNPDLGFGAVFRNKWIFGQWEPGFIEQQQPSISFLELYALTAGILTWSDKLLNMRIIVYCGNQAAVEMINQTTSKCHNCIFLIRLLVLSGLTHNRCVYARYIRSKENLVSDSLSRLDFTKFWQVCRPDMREQPTPLPSEIWPLSKVWKPVH